MKRTLFASIALAISLSFAAPTAFAQDKPDPKKAKTYDFTGDEIDGDLVKPDGEFLNTRTTADHKSLIRIRLDFIKEILKSAEDL